MNTQLSCRYGRNCHHSCNVQRHPHRGWLFFGLVLWVAMAFQEFAAASEAARAYTGEGLIASHLRCEYRTNPLGIDEISPRLSWIVESGQRGQRQSACRLLVASSQKLLRQDQGDLWDSGKIASDETIGTVYGGKPLVSQQRCFWKVKVWDKDGHESPWSRPALWSTGLLKPDDWKAEWIGYDKARQPALSDAPFDGAKWIWHGADAPDQAPQGPRVFVSRFTVPPQMKVKQAELYATANGGLRFVINGSRVLSVEPTHESWKAVKTTAVTAHVRAGENELRVEVQKPEPGPLGWLAKLVITAQDGQTITSVTDGSWKSTDHPGEDWIKGSLDSSSWPTVRVVADYGAAPWGKLQVSGLFLPPTPYLRTGFRIEKPVVRATLYATALGLVDMHLNGRRVSEDYFTPGWTDYAKRVYYRTYDVTDQVRRGDNALGAVLADGWFSGFVGYRGARDLYGKWPRVRVQLHLEFADGSCSDVATDGNWRAATGPVREADFLKGESCDARLECAGWDEPGFDDGKWDRAVAGCDEVHPLVQAHPGPPVRALQEFRAQKITEPKPGVYVLDLGQNFAGVPRLKVRGQPGQKITLRFGERLQPDGTLYTVNLRGARATDTYICKGKGLEVWQPRFTFHGFQYIEVTGLKKKPAPDTVTGIALSSATPIVGEFDCSDPMLNRLHNNIYWTQRANFIDIPTDCPQRDERLGWTGDAQVYVRAATLNTDVESFFTKWLVDLDTDGQRGDGQFPCVAPVKVSENDGGPAWADAGVICPWTIYEVYGDRRVLERHYDEMKRFIEFCVQRSTPELLPPQKYHCFGDWLSINADTPKDVIYTAYFAYSTKLVARAAAALGRTEDEAKYRALEERIRAAFNRAYVAADGRIKGETQTGYVLALAFDLVEGDQAKRAADYLVENIEKRGWHLSTGFIGTKDLMLALSKIGRPDVAYRLLHNDTFPSWGFSIKQGATSIWERWDGWTPEKGFQNPGMNSFAHYSFGAVHQWMVENIGGIRNASPAYKEIVIAPQTDEKLTWAKVGYQSIRGAIATESRVKDGKRLLEVTIPANTTATVVLPARSAADITESGRPIGKARGVNFLRQEGPNAILTVASGRYAFSVPER
jgi:alpha-L-rhamnosidase